MNKTLVKATLHSAETNTRKLLEKFLAADKFNLMDIYWWWNPDCSWWMNMPVAIKVLRILRQEGCVTRIIGFGCCYQKTSAFVELLHEMIRLEDILKGTDEWL